jgi:hypothetical protein
MSEAMKTQVQNSGLLVGEPLKPIAYATNFACAPTIFDHQVPNEKECSKPMDVESLPALRKELVDPVRIFQEPLQDARKSISSNQYLNFDVRLVSVGTHFAPEIYPACFKNTSLWLWGIRKSPDKVFNLNYTKGTWKKMIAPNGKVTAQRSDESRIDFEVKFHPRALYQQKNSDVNMVANGMKAEFLGLAACE